MSFTTVSWSPTRRARCACWRRAIRRATTSRARTSSQGDSSCRAARATVCEWKGAATYFDVVTPGGRVERAAWTYTAPKAGFEEIRDAVAFYAQAVDECWVDDERVIPQEGSFYGGWITSDVVGPFKGAAGTTGW